MQLSLVVCAYNMERELPRTVFTLGPGYQRGVEGLDYEIVVVDNGSRRPVCADALREIAPNTRVIRIDEPSPSPARAINAAVHDSAGQLIGLFIDGARMASPGLLAAALSAYRADPTKVIGSLAFHLGPDVQMRSVRDGYDQSAEDALLASVNWREDGYALFSKSVLAGSSSQGWFGTLPESNGVFLDRTSWDRLGGLDERFSAPGGGFVNLDFWKRAVELHDDEPWIILGEGTFHQVHGGAATNGSDRDRRLMQAEYKALFGVPFAKPSYRPRFIGSLDPELAKRFAGQPPGRPRQAHSVRGRAFRVGLPPQPLSRIQAGSLRTRYKGRRLAKNPFDLVIYLQLLERLRPRTIIEVGTSEGGSALWFRDQCRALKLECDVLTMDVAPPVGDIDGVSIFEADATRPAETFPHDVIAAAAHPWLVTEDSAHLYESTSAVLEYFDPLLAPGDYVAVEDGVVADLPGEQYRKYRDGPNRAVRDFLQSRGARYEIDTELCDFFGHNLTYCPNAWLVRT